MAVKQRVLYEGGEGSRIYDGQYRIRWQAKWPNDSLWHGLRVEGETESGDYEAMQAALRGGLAVAIVGPERYNPEKSGRWVVPATRAIIERVS